MIRAAIVALALPLGACGAAQGVQSTTSEQAAPSHKYVGTTRYVERGHVGLCETPRLDTLGCPSLKAGTPLKIIGARLGRQGVVDNFEVEANGKTGFVSDLSMSIYTSDEVWHAKQVAEKKECDRKGGINVGMTADQVLKTCWGKPRSVNTTHTGRGSREQWVYGSDYVYVENGVVTAIQTSRR